MIVKYRQLLLNVIKANRAAAYIYIDEMVRLRVVHYHLLLS